MSRNNTNRLLKDLALMVEQDPDDIVRITIVVGGQLISGTMITEDQFFNLQDNVALREHFQNEIKAKREAMIDDVSVEKLPDELSEFFIYLKNVYYISGGFNIPVDSDDGLSAQVRVSDISVFTYKGA